MSKDIHRYVVSTHTMALATSVDRWLDNRTPLSKTLRESLGDVRDGAALPKKLVRRCNDNDARLVARKLPILLDELREQLESSDPDERVSGDQRLKEVEEEVEKLFGGKPERYYALLILDGDRMGAWLTSNESKYQITYRQSWHPKIRAKADQFPQLNGYLDAARAASPAHHMAISSALNSFALKLTSHIVEYLCKGKLIYAGGDDVLAMLSIDDLLPAMCLLRYAYSGLDIGTLTWLGIDQETGMKIRGGHVLHEKTLHRVMGEKATASMGAVVAHHKEPLGKVVRELRQAEKRAKEQGGRDAFSIMLLKRSGGAVELTSPWLVKNGRNSAIDLLVRFRDAFSGPDLSRRAAYHVQDWIKKLPPESSMSSPGQYVEMLATNICYQMKRQSHSQQSKELHGELGKRLAHVAVEISNQHRKDRNGGGKTDPAVIVERFLSVSEFLAREGRVKNRGGEKPEREAAHG